MRSTAGGVPVAEGRATRGPCLDDQVAVSQGATGRGAHAPPPAPSIAAIIGIRPSPSTRGRCTSRSSRPSGCGAERPGPLPPTAAAPASECRRSPAAVISGKRSSAAESQRGRSRGAASAPAWHRNARRRAAAASAARHVRHEVCRRRREREAVLDVEWHEGRDIQRLVGPSRAGRRPRPAAGAAASRSAVRHRCC